MSASLVGSEMCIRDSRRSAPLGALASRTAPRPGRLCAGGGSQCVSRSLGLLLWMSGGRGVRRGIFPVRQVCEVPKRRGRGAEFEP
eukprot:10302454-Alexandrium_andersonii.AAC.1